MKKIIRRSIFIIFLFLVCYIVYAIFSIHKLLDISKKAKVNELDHKYNIVVGTGYYSDDVIYSFLDGARTAANNYDAVVNLLKPESSADNRSFNDWTDFAKYSCADGLILFSYDDKLKSTELYDTHKNQIPVVIAGFASDESKQESFISINRYQLGKEIAYLLNEHKEWNLIKILFIAEQNVSDVERILSFVKTNLDKEKSVQICGIDKKSVNDEIRKSLMSSVQYNSADIVVCLTPEILDIAAQAIIDLNLKDRLGLIGISGRKKSKEYLEKGIVSALFYYDSWRMGYNSVNEIFSWKKTGFSNSLNVLDVKILKGGEK